MAQDTASATAQWFLSGNVDRERACSSSKQHVLANARRLATFLGSMPFASARGGAETLVVSSTENALRSLMEPTVGVQGMVSDT